MAGLLDQLDGDPAVDKAVGDEALIRAMLDVEIALVRALAKLRLVPAEAAEVIDRATTQFHVDPDSLGLRAAESGSPVIPLVRDLIAAVPEGAQDAVHLGATSQDILDTALQLVAHRAMEPMLDHLNVVCETASRLADKHRHTLMVARTLGQPALPSVFGLRVAGWLVGVTTATSGLAGIRTSTLAVQLGGAAGTMAAYGNDGPDVAAHLALELGLVDPGVPWHTERSRIHALGAALGSAVAACGKVATDVVLMSQREVAELAEGSPGGSSAMPHKRNPTRSILVIAAARRAPGLVGTLLASGLHEQERATGSWHAEWPVLRELLRLAGGAAARMEAVITGLRVDHNRMRHNLDAAGPQLMSEALTGRLIPVLGRIAAQEAVRNALDAAPDGGLALAAALRADPEVAAVLTENDIVTLLDPAHNTGVADVVIDRSIRQHAKQRAAWQTSTAPGETK